MNIMIHKPLFSSLNKDLMDKLSHHSYTLTSNKDIIENPNYGFDLYLVSSSDSYLILSKYKEIEIIKPLYDRFCIEVNFNFIKTIAPKHAKHIDIFCNRKSNINIENLSENIDTYIKNIEQNESIIYNIFKENKVIEFPSTVFGSISIDNRCIHKNMSILTGIKVNEFDTLGGPYDTPLFSENMDRHVKKITGSISTENKTPPSDFPPGFSMDLHNHPFDDDNSNDNTKTTKIKPSYLYSQLSMTSCDLTRDMSNSTPSYIDQNEEILKKNNIHKIYIIIYKNQTIVCEDPTIIETIRMNPKFGFSVLYEFSIILHPTEVEQNDECDFLNRYLEYLEYLSNVDSEYVKEICTNITKEQIKNEIIEVEKIRDSIPKITAKSDEIQNIINIINSEFDGAEYVKEKLDEYVKIINNMLLLLNVSKTKHIKEQNYIEDYINDKYHISDDSSKKIKAQQLFDEVSYFLMTQKYFKEVPSNVVLSKSLANMGLSKKRCSDGNYYYGLEQRLKTKRESDIEILKQSLDNSHKN